MDINGRFSIKRGLTFTTLFDGGLDEHEVPTAIWRYRAPTVPQSISGTNLILEAVARNGSGPVGNPEIDANLENLGLSWRRHGDAFWHIRSQGF